MSTILCKNNFLVASGVIVASYAFFVLTRKLKRNPEDIYNFHKVYFMNPLCTKKDCNVPNCREQGEGSPVEIFSKIAKEMDSAKFSIDIAIYVITSIEIRDALIRARERGVRVRMIVDNSQAYSESSQVGKLMKYIELRSFTATDGLMHHKFCIIDGSDAIPGQLDTVFGWCKSVLDCVPKWPKSAGDNGVCAGNSILVTGSLNWTIRGKTANCENVILTTNRALIREFLHEFERLWTHLSS